MTDEMDSMTSGIDGNWWLRWYGSDGFDFTLHWPWWVSGYAGDSTVLVAAVRATSEEAAKAIVESAHAKGKIEWSFAEPRDVDWSPFCDRFPRAKWMHWPGGATAAATAPESP